MRYTRRQFSSLLASGFFSAGYPGTLAAPTKPRIQLAVESWSFRELLGQDPEGTLARVAEIGYEAIELAHYYQWEKLTASTVARALRASGLKCCSSHINLEVIQDDQLERTLDYHRTIGNSVLIIASLPHQTTIVGWQDLARRVSERAAKLSEHGFRLGYHNHPGDFQPVEGQIPWEVFFKHTDPRVIHQLDVGNMLQEHRDPRPYLKMFPGRTQSIHVKDRDANYQPVVVGEGALPWNDILEICSTTGGTEWYIIEYESKQYPPLEAIRRCLEGFKRIVERWQAQRA